MVDRVFIIGLSMGGILSLLFASQHPVSGVVAISTPYSLPDDPRLPYIRIFSWVMPKMNKGLPDWQNPEGAKDHVEYPYFSTKALIQLRDLLVEMRNSLPKVTAPALLIHSRQDKSVALINVEKIYTALGSQQKQIVLVENSGHVIPREPDRLIAFKSVADFIKQVTDPGKP
jgi:carboxylesterase